MLISNWGYNNILNVQKNVFEVKLLEKCLLSKFEYLVAYFIKMKDFSDFDKMLFCSCSDLSILNILCRLVNYFCW